MEIVRTQTGGLEKIEVGKRDVLIFRLNRVTDQISQHYIDEARKVLAEILPDGVQAMIVGCDVDVLAISGEAATAMKIKGIGKIR